MGSENSNGKAEPSKARGSSFRTTQGKGANNALIFNSPKLPSFTHGRGSWSDDFGRWLDLATLNRVSERRESFCALSSISVDEVLPSTSVPWAIFPIGGHGKLGTADGSKYELIYGVVREAHKRSP